MKRINTIKTFDTSAFRERYIQVKPAASDLLKPGFEKFFIVRVEEMIRLMKLPVPPSRTTSNTIIYLTEGNGTMRIGSEKYKMAAHECVIVPAGQVFSFEKIEENKGYLLNFHNEIIVGMHMKSSILGDFEFLQVWGNHRIRFDKRSAGFINHLLMRLLTDYSEYGIKNPGILQSYVIALLAEMNGAYMPVSKDGQKQSLNITNKFKTLLHANLKSKHQVGEYASLLNISPNHLNKCVRNSTGKSPGRWIDEAIVLEAKVLLYQSELSINQISEQVGLLDQSYFSRLFKKYEGITPLDFRKRIDKS